MLDGKEPGNGIFIYLIIATSLQKLWKINKCFTQNKHLNNKIGIISNTLDVVVFTVVKIDFLIC